MNDIAFIPNSERVAVCSKQGYVRIYDPKVTTQRRPVIKIDLPNTAFSCISTTSQSHYVLVGSTTGESFIDLRRKVCKIKAKSILKIQQLIWDYSDHNN